MTLYLPMLITWWEHSVHTRILKLNRGYESGIYTSYYSSLYSSHQPNRLFYYITSEKSGYWPWLNKKHGVYEYSILFSRWLDDYSIGINDFN